MDVATGAIHHLEAGGRPLVEIVSFATCKTELIIHCDLFTYNSNTSSCIHTFKGTFREKQDFCEWTSKSLKAALIAKNIKFGFWKTRIWPIDQEATMYAMVIVASFEEERHVGSEKRTSDYREPNATREASGCNKCNDDKWGCFGSNLELDNDSSDEDDLDLEPIDRLPPYLPCTSSK